VPRSIALAVVVAVASLIGIVFFYGRAHESTLSPQAVSAAIAPQRLDRPAPAFHADTISGKQVDLADYTGKPLIINFFASWCPPCRQDAPRIADLARSYRGRVQVLGVAGDDTRSGVDHFITRYGWHFPILWDPHYDLFTTFGIANQPVTFIVDSQGHLRERFLGPVDLAEARQTLNGLLG
jgi:cytochrome c biogenesis protein CcmG, thiol:disulfide interchange protein DsbE